MRGRIPEPIFAMIDTILILAASVPEVGESTNPVAQLARQFGVEWKFLAAQIINFCIVAFLLYKLAFKPVLATIEERQEKIADGLQYAEEMKSKLAESKKKQIEVLKEAQKEARKIIKEARTSAKSHLEAQARETSDRIEAMLDKARKASSLEREKMLTEAKSEIAKLVVQTSAKVLGKKLSEKEKSTFSESAAKELASMQS